MVGSGCVHGVLGAGGFSQQFGVGVAPQWALFGWKFGQGCGDVGVEQFGQIFLIGAALYVLF